jgi:Flp pilus assembly protein TadD
MSDTTPTNQPEPKLEDQPQDDQSKEQSQPQEQPKPQAEPKTKPPSNLNHSPRHQHPNRKFTLLATLTLLAAAAGLATLWPLALQAARAKATSLVGEAAKASGGEAEVDYRLATWLDPESHTAYVGLARSLITAGHPDEALAALGQAGEGSEVEQLKVRTLIELGRYNEAADVAGKLATPNRQDDDHVLAALAYALADRNSDIDALMPHVSSPEALQRIKRAQAGKLTLAAELYATGLLQSSSAFLMKLPASYERNLLLARIRYARHTPDDLARAAESLEVATSFNPSAPEARQLLAQTYRDQGKTTEAGLQDTLITKLQAGRP